MADLTQAIREMAKKGLNEAQIVSSLRDLGVRNPEAVYKQAMDNLKPVTPVSNEVQEPVKREARQPRLEALSTPPSAQRASAPEVQPAVLPQARASPSGEPLLIVEEEKPLPPRATASADKLDEAIALLKALHEVNKKILETNRDILMRLKQ